MDDDNKPNGPKGPMAGSMQGSTPQKRKHSLNRETQTRLGVQLQKMYNTYLNEGTPDRFRDFIHRLESGQVPGVSEGQTFEGVEDTPDNKES